MVNSATEKTATGTTTVSSASTGPMCATPSISYAATWRPAPVAASEPKMKKCPYPQVNPRSRYRVSTLADGIVKYTHHMPNARSVPPNATRAASTDHPCSSTTAEIARIVPSTTSPRVMMTSNP